MEAPNRRQSESSEEEPDGVELCVETRDTERTRETSGRQDQHLRKAIQRRQRRLPVVHTNHPLCASQGEYSAKKQHRTATNGEFELPSGVKLPNDREDSSVDESNTDSEKSSRATP